jgi:hypothetical protein
MLCAYKVQYDFGCLTMPPLFVNVSAMLESAGDRNSTLPILLFVRSVTAEPLFPAFTTFAGRICDDSLNNKQLV